MFTGSRTRFWHWPGLGLFLVDLRTCRASAATPKRVLILDSFGHDRAPVNPAASTFRATLAREFGEPVDICEASLDAARLAEPEKAMPFVGSGSNPQKVEPDELQPGPAAPPKTISP